MGLLKMLSVLARGDEQAQNKLNYVHFCTILTFQCDSLNYRWQFLLWEKKCTEWEEKKKKFLDLAGLRKKSQPHDSRLLILLWKGLTCRERGKAALSFISRTSSYLVFGDKQCIWRPLRSRSIAALRFGMTAWVWHSWTKKPFHSPSYRSPRGFSFLSVPPAICIKLFFATGAQCWVTEHCGVTLHGNTFGYQRATLGLAHKTSPKWGEICRKTAQDWVPHSFTAAGGWRIIHFLLTCFLSFQAALPQKGLSSSSDACDVSQELPAL